MQKKWNRMLALTLALAMAVSLCTPWTFALEGTAEAEADASVSEATPEAEDAAESEGSPEAEDAAESEESPEPEGEAAASAAPALTWLAVMQPNLSAPCTQQIAVGFGDDTRAPERASVTVREETTGEAQTYEATSLTEGAAAFAIEYASGAAGAYCVETLRYTYDGVETELSLAEIGVEARYGVDTEVTTDPDDVLVLQDTEDTCDVELEVSALSEDGTLEHVDSIEEALTVGEALAAENSEDAALSLDGAASVASDIGEDLSDENIIIVLDPGHDAAHAGAQSGSYQEEVLTLKIAQYCREALERYEGITVYMTRTTEECPFPDAEDPENGTTGTSRACLFGRVEYAASVGADYYISIHINASGGTGAEIYYPNENYATNESNSAVPEDKNLSEDGEGLAQSIMDQLTALGITIHEEGVQSEDSEYGWTYDDGSMADDYLVIRESKKQGICGIIIEHCYIDSSDADKYLSSEEKLQALGEADATGIANYLGLETNGIVLSGTLEYGTWSADVTAVQERLQELGYFTVAVDGGYGAKTEAAVIMFQAANGMDPDSAALGKVDAWTANALNSDDAVACTTYQSGSTGNAVSCLQKYLIKLGYLGLSKPNGSFDQMTEEAMEDFQTDNSLEATGAADQATLALLYNRNTGTLASKSLTYGDSGDKVKALQLRLKELGYFTAGVDASFGAKTEAAVIMFQAANGLNVYSSTYGTVTAWTQKTLNSASAVACTTYQSGSSGTAVYRIQKYLIDRGYLELSEPNSDFDEATEAALQEFQSDNGLSETGVADQATLALLYNRNTGNRVTKIATTLAYGDSGEEVRRLQERLRKLGYYTTTADASFGNKTEAAVIMFQAANGLELDEAEYGTVEEQTLALLNSSSALSFTSCQNGSKGTAVYRLQKYLIQLYYLVIAEPDSSFGKLTKAAIEDFQRDNSLTVTGVADQATLTALYSRGAKAHVTEVSSKTLSYGSTGDAVTLLQRRLRELGYFTVLPDGGYGAKTEAAVIMFQAANGMNVTSTTFGTVKSRTIEKLNSSSAVACTTYQSGSKGTAVYRLQKYLIDLGYLNISAPDSGFGRMTQAAVEDFQSDNDLAVTGVADQATLAVLYNRNTKSAASRWLNYGDSGSAVKLLQERLKELGYFNATVDASFGVKTEAAVIMFQAANGLNVYSSTFGTVTRWTEDLLNSDDAIAYTAYQNGSTGTGVYRLQKYLINLGYLKISEPDSSFGKLTKAAVEGFQADHGLKATGVADQATLTLLYNRNTKKNS